VDISKTVADMAKVTINDYNMKSHMGFPLTPRSMTRWPWIALNSISLNFQWISRDFADFGSNNS